MSEWSVIESNLLLFRSPTIRNRFALSGFINSSLIVDVSQHETGVAGRGKFPAPDIHYGSDKRPPRKRKFCLVSSLA